MTESIFSVFWMSATGSAVSRMRSARLRAEWCRQERRTVRSQLRSGNCYTEHGKTNAGKVSSSTHRREGLGTGTLSIVPGSPWENAYREGFKGKLRDECLNGEIFYSLREAQVVTEQWRVEYNTIRPHSALGYRPAAPAAFAPDEVVMQTRSLAVVQKLGPVNARSGYEREKSCINDSRLNRFSHVISALWS